MRETEAEAWAAAEKLISKIDSSAAEAAHGAFRRFESEGQRRMTELASRADLVVAPNSWAGVGLVRGGAGTALVGNPRQVADRLLEYRDLGIDRAQVGGDALGGLALDRLQRAWERGRSLGAQERGETSLAVATFKVAAARAGLDAAGRLFDITGARGAAGRYGFDRFWRNVRTHSLHDPLDYKLKELGVHTLTGALPEPGFYS